MSKRNSQKGGNKKNKEEEDKLLAISSNSNDEELDYVEDAGTEEDPAVRSPVRKLAKTVLKEMDREKDDGKSLKDTGNSSNPGLIVNGTEGTEIKDQGEKILQLRSRPVSRDRSVAKRLDFNKEVEQISEPLNGEGVDASSNKINEQNSESSENKNQPLDRDQTVTTPIPPEKMSQTRSSENMNDTQGKGETTPRVKRKLTPKVGKAKGKGIKAKGLKRLKKIILSDTDSSSDSSESDSESSTSSDDETTYRRGRQKRRKKDTKRRRRRSRSRSSSEERHQEVKKRRRRRSRSKAKKGESMKAILQELAELKKQLKSGKSKGSTPQKTDRDEPDLIKSPSDTGLLAPAVMRDHDYRSPQLNVTNQIIDKNRKTAETVSQGKSDAMIIEFLKNIRLAGKEDEPKIRSQVTRVAASTSQESEEDRARRHDRERAQKEVIDAEKFNATINPPGMSYYQMIKQLNLQDPDEEYFHIVCHVEQGLKDKIKKGQFVELERLIRKNRFSKQKERWQMGRDTDGTPMWEPCEDKETKINNVYKWDQAFRVYATIYSQEHPSRAAEIWQYIESIHNAAKIYCWDNVANYDYCFRQLMNDNPDRSWAKPYLQMWTTTLCEPYNRVQNRGESSGKNNRFSNVCWKFNKHKCNNPNCRYEHRCSYCGGTNHTSLTCFKKNGSKRKQRRERDRSESRSRSPKKRSNKK